MNFYTKNFCCRNGHITRLLLIMKMAIVILITAIMQVSAGTYAQNITLQQKNAKLQTVFNEIRKQSGYDFLYNEAIIKKLKPISIDVKNASIEQTLKSAFEGLPITYSITDKVVMVSEKEEIGIVEKVRGLFQQPVPVLFKLTDKKGDPLPGGTAYILSTQESFRTDESGSIALRISKDEKIQFNYLGYKTQIITITLAEAKSKRGQFTNVFLEQNPLELKEVAVEGSNGYQSLPRERSTGSFQVITAKDLQHSSDPNLIKRLQGITTSLNFNDQLTFTNSANTAIPFGAPNPLAPENSPLTRLTIRGRNTLNGIGVPSTVTQSLNTSGIPLVIIDGIASPYSIDNVNPNDVETITILKDAAAASIWGSRAANGVIVVTTKRGKYERPVSINFNTNFNLTDKPDLFYNKSMSVSEYIDAQILKYNTQYSAPNSFIPNPGLDLFDELQPLMSPVAEIMNAWKMNPTPAATAERDAKLNALRGNDIRNDFEKYFFRKALTQSYFLGLNGGSRKVAWSFSGGYDNNRNNTIASGSDRWSLSYNTSFKPFKNLELTAGINYAVYKTKDQSPNNPVRGGLGGAYFPYTQLVDDNGNPTVIPYKFRPGFIDLLNTTYGNKIQDLSFTPLKDVYEGYFNNSNKSLNFNLTGNYKLTDFLSVDVAYNFNKGNSLSEGLNGRNSFYMREHITYFTLPDGTQQFPAGAWLQQTESNSAYHSVRGQLNVNKTWNEKHALTAIAGLEATDNYSLSKQFQYLGYDEDKLSYSNQLDYNTPFATLYPSNSPSYMLFAAPERLPSVPNQFITGKVRTYSLFANAAYTYKFRYTLSASARKDANNQFGTEENIGGSPFYSVGGKWDINKEPFYHLSWLPNLSLRTTFGYNGNANPSVLGYPNINFIGLQLNNLPASTAGNIWPTNNRLRPEKTGQLNFGLDFGFKNGRINGSIEHYDKYTTDLLAQGTLDPSTGFNNKTYNTGNLHGYGWEFSLNSRNIQAGKFSWNSNFLFAYNRVKITKLYTNAATTVSGVIGSNGLNVGYDLSRLFAYRFAGLDHSTGSAMGYINGQPKIIDGSTWDALNNQPMSEAHYFGSSVPVEYGSFRNTFTYGAFSASVNLRYEFGYYFRKTSVVNYYNLFMRDAPQPAEYSQRWKQPGDEAFTNVPAQVVYTSYSTSLQDIFYQQADIHILKGDNIRIQEINLDYAVPVKKNWFIKNPRVYLNMPLNVVIWRANKEGIDPQTRDFPIPRTYSFGFSTSF